MSPTVTVAPPCERKVTLELTERQAQIIRSILNEIGGRYNGAEDVYTLWSVMGEAGIDVRSDLIKGAVVNGGKFYA